MIAGSLVARSGMAPGEITGVGQSSKIAEMTSAAQSGKIEIGPTAENALEAEKAVNQALLTSDADALGRLLADDWVVISAYGGMAERGPFIAEIKMQISPQPTR